MSYKGDFSHRRGMGCFPPVASETTIEIHCALAAYNQLNTHYEALFDILQHEDDSLLCTSPRQGDGAGS